MCATTRSFEDMLNEYLPNDLLKEEFGKRDYVLSNLMAKKLVDDKWKTGDIIVPFKAAGASSAKYGGLTAANNIGEDLQIRGKISGAKELWGSLIYNHRDIMEHEKVSEQNFLDLLPGSIDDFMNYMKRLVSKNFLVGAHFAKLTAASAANDGVIVVDRPDSFMINQLVYVFDSTTSNSVMGYVRTINRNTKTLVLYSARSGGAVIDFSAVPMTHSTAFPSRCYHDGVITGTGAAAGSLTGNQFTGMRQILLSAANGGDTNYLGFAKTAYPQLQAYNIDGSTVTSTNIMEKLFDGIVEVRQYTPGMPTELIMSYTNFARCIKIIEIQKGNFNVVPNSQKASQYGWMEVEIGSLTKGNVKLVGIQEAEDDVIIFMDWRSWKFYSNGFFQKRVSPEGNSYFEVRNETGYQYIVDSCLFGQLVCRQPGLMAIMHSIP